MKHSLIRYTLGAVAALLLSAGFVQAAERLDGFAVENPSRGFIIMEEDVGPSPLPIPPCGNQDQY